MTKVALTAISVQINPDEIRDLKELFMALDVNGDGSITIEELEHGLKDKENGDTLIQLLRAADTDGSGDINYSEFIAATLDQNIYMNEKYLQQVFDMFDTDRSGKIDNEEVVKLLSGDGLENIVPKDAIDRAIKEID